jgi:hypothetical protein
MPWGNWVSGIALLGPSVGPLATGRRPPVPGDPVDE